MKPTDQQIVDSIERLARDQFDPAVDWPVCFELVRREVARRKLPARDYAPSSQFGGTDWTIDDFTELADEWICLIRGDRARQLAGTGRAIAHVANSARRSAYHFVISQMRASPRKDLVAALKDVLPEFSNLTAGEANLDWRIPDQQFPWQHPEQRSARRRAITAPEVRTALRTIHAVQPTGWSYERLIDCLAQWSGLGSIGERSLDAVGPVHAEIKDHQDQSVDSALTGREAARTLLSKLNEDEQNVLRGFVIPNGLGNLGLEQAAAALGMSKSTLHDRAARLRKKLASLEHREVGELDAAAREAFLDEILREPGNAEAEQSIE